MPKVLTLSHSAIQKFQECPASYYFKYERGITLRSDKGDAPLLFGAAIHEALEARGKGASLQEATETFLKAFPSDLTHKHTIKAGKLMLKEYYDRYRVENFKVLKNEEKFVIDLGECLYKIKIDKLIEQDGKLQVLDHKTTSNLGATFFEMTNPNGQFTGYIYGANLKYKKANGVDTLVVDGLLVPYPYKTKELQTDFERIVIHRTAKELEIWKENTIDVAIDIKTCKATGVWVRHDHVYQRCVSRFTECPYRMLCVMPMRIEEMNFPEETYKKYGEEKKN